MMTETEACIALNMVPKIGPVRLRKLLEVFDSPQNVLSARPSALRQVEGIGPDTAEALGSWESQIDLAAELQRIEDFGAHVITQADPLYPPSLLEIHNPPIVLYVWGKLEERDRHAVGVVGSRKTSHYGLECAKKLSYQLAYAGATVVSGLARGIDTAAHQGALAAQGRTIAVIGSGFSKVYPPENQGLAEKIAETGAVLSEYPMLRQADTQTFPYRNRIVAGMSFGLLVVEAGMQSGALITAGNALEQGRNVYAVPGQIDRPTAQGSNRLIQQGAKLVSSAADILDDMHALFPVKPTPEAPATRIANLNPMEAAVFDALDVTEKNYDEVVARCHLTTAQVSSTLLALEMKRLIKQLPGTRFVRLV